MSGRGTLGVIGALVATALAAYAGERDRGYVPEARAIAVLGPPSASAPRDLHRAAVLALLGGELPAGKLPSTGPGVAFVPPPEDPPPPGKPAGESVAPPGPAVVTLADVAITGKSPGSEERLELLLDDATRCATSSTRSIQRGGSIVFEKRAWKGHAEDLTLVTPLPHDALGGPSGAFATCVRDHLRDLRFLPGSPEIVVRGTVRVAAVKRP